MEQHFMLLFNYLLLFPKVKNNSSKILSITSTYKIITTITKTSSATTFSTKKSLESFLQNDTQYLWQATTSLALLHLSVKMGSCFGRLEAKEPKIKKTTTRASYLWRQATDEQETELIETDIEEETNLKRKKSIFRIIKFKHKEKRKQFMDKFRLHQEKNYCQLDSNNGYHDSSSEIQLQNLDVNNLLNSSNLAAESVINAANCTSAPFSSRTSSSLDLEWEHEYVNHLRSSYAFSLIPPTAVTTLNCLQPTTNTVVSSGGATTTTTTFVNFATPTPSNYNDIDLDSWQFLSQCRNFDDDELLDSLQPSQSLRNSPSVPKITTTTKTVRTTRTEIGKESFCRERLDSPNHANDMESKKQYHSNAVPKKLQPNSKHHHQQQQQQQLLYQQRTGLTRPFGGLFSSFTRTSSRTSCSHISTPESLEWDIDEEQQRQMHVEDDNLGLETLQLLHQIEQLKKKVLNETGESLFDGHVDDDEIDGFLNICEEYIAETDIS